MLDSLEDDTRARYDDEMRYIGAIVHRELRAHGLVDGEQPAAWRPVDAIHRLPSDSSVGHELCSLLEAAIVVEFTYRSLWGERERLIDVYERMAASIRAAHATSTAPAGTAYLRSASNVGGMIALNEEPRVDSSVVATLARDWERLLAEADDAERMAEELKRRRPPALTAKTYAARRPGPLSHLCWELTRPTLPPEDRAALAAHPKATKKLKRSLTKPRLSYEQLGRLVDMTYANSKRSKEDLKAAAGRVRQRVISFCENLEASATRE
jgi:hypothetical protein